MRGEKTAVDNDATKRGIVGSGIQVAAHRRAKRQYIEDVRDHQVATIRATEDAFAELGWVERQWMNFKTRREDGDAPLEQRLIPPSQRVVADDDLVEE